jgi:hypothetical protein
MAADESCRSGHEDLARKIRMIHDRHLQAQHRMRLIYPLGQLERGHVSR